MGLEKKSRSVYQLDHIVLMISKSKSIFNQIITASFILTTTAAECISVITFQWFLCVITLCVTEKLPLNVFVNKDGHLLFLFPECYKLLLYISKNITWFFNLAPAVLFKCRFFFFYPLNASKMTNCHQLFREKSRWLQFVSPCNWWNLIFFSTIIADQYQ